MDGGRAECDAIERLRQGDAAGLEVLVRRYQLQAVRAAQLIVRDRPLAEDIVQSAFLRAYERIDQFDPARPFGPWFLRSVVNDALKAANRARWQVPLDEPERLEAGDLMSDPGLDPEYIVELFERAGSVRAAVVLRYYLDLSHAEAAERLAVPVGTVKWRLHAARKRLRRLLGSEESEPVRSLTDE